MASEPTYPPRIDARFAAILLSVWGLIITLWPFRPVADVAEWVEHLARSVLWIDWSVLLHLIAAAGFGVALAAGWPGQVARLGLVRAVVIAAAAAIALELAQTFMADRHAGVADVLAHLLGAVAGLRAGPGCWPRRGARAAGWAVVLGCVAATVGLALVEGRLAGFDGWDEEALLVVGNEATGDRPWLGEVHGIAIYARTLDPQQARYLARERWQTDRAIPDRHQRGAVTVYMPRNAFQLSPLTGLRWIASERGRINLDLFAPPGSPIIADAAGVRLRGSAVLATPEPVGPLTQLIRRRRTFSVEAYVTPATTSQVGPARIVSLSRSPGKRNFTVGQDGSSLRFRVRTPLTGVNADERDADPRWPNVFISPSPVHLLVTCGRGELRLYVNGRPYGRATRLHAIHLLSGGSPEAVMAAAAAFLALPLGLVAPAWWGASRKPRRAVVVWLLAAAATTLAFDAAVGPGGGWYAAAALSAGVLLATAALGAWPAFGRRPG